MGFNISGMVIDNNFNKSIDEFEDAMHWGIEVIEEINFEQASANWTPDETVNIYFSEKATMIFYPFEWSLEPDHPQNVNSLGFAYSETAMTFAVSYLDEKGNYRFFIENEGERQLESGSALPLEKEFPTADGLIFKLIDVLLGQSFFSIDPNEIAYRCKKIPYNQNKIEAKIITNNSIITESEVIFEEVQAAPSVNEVESNVIKKVKNEIIVEKSEHPILEKQPTKKWWEFWK